MIKQLTVQEIEICNGGKKKEETITPLTAGCCGLAIGLIFSQLFYAFAIQGLGARERIFYSVVIWGAVGAFVYKTTVGIVLTIDDEEYHDYPGL